MACARCWGHSRAVTVPVLRVTVIFPVFQSQVLRVWLAKWQTQDLRPGSSNMLCIAGDLWATGLRGRCCFSQDADLVNSNVPVRLAQAICVE